MLLDNGNIAVCNVKNYQANQLKMIQVEQIEDMGKQQIY